MRSTQQSNYLLYGGSFFLVALPFFCNTLALRWAVVGRICSDTGIYTESVHHSTHPCDTIDQPPSHIHRRDPFTYITEFVRFVVKGVLLTFFMTLFITVTFFGCVASFFGNMLLVIAHELRMCSSLHRQREGRWYVILLGTPDRPFGGRP